jgi:hypothetical protein
VGLIAIGGLFPFSFSPLNLINGQLMDPEPLTPAAWFATIFPPSHVTSTPIYKRRPYHHHKDNFPELEPIFQALRGYIPFGGLAQLSRRINIAESTLSTWK